MEKQSKCVRIFYKSQILKGLNAIEMFHALIEEDMVKELPLLNTLYNFFVNQESELEFKFGELIDLKQNR